MLDAELLPIALVRTAQISANVVGFYFFMKHMKEGAYDTGYGATPLYVLCFLGYCFREFVMHAGGHRYFAHKSYKCSPWFCNFMAITLCEIELGVLYLWVFQHNEHHAHCEGPLDHHSPHADGFWPVQLGVTKGLASLGDLFGKLVGPGAPPNKLLKTKFDSDLSWMKLHVTVPFFFVCVFLWGLLGYSLGYYPLDFLFWASIFPRFLSLQAASLTNSAAHMFGPRPYTGNGHAPFPKCLATNCWWVALINGGEGWHNNHHAFCLSARHGLLWYEIDTVWMTLRLLAHLGIVYDLIECSDEVRLTPRNPKVEPHFERKYTVRFTKNPDQKIIE